MIKKSLYDISWQVSEEKYRENSALSYSMIAKYAREGFKTLFDTKKIDTSSLRFGSLVDCLLTEPETFEDRFIIIDMKIPSDTIVLILEQIYESLQIKTPNIYEVPEEVIFDFIEKNEYGASWLRQTRINKILTSGASYFKSLFDKDGKIAILQTDYDDAQNCVLELENNPYTADFVNNPNLDYIEDLHQTKFILTNPYKVRCMFDKIRVDHQKKLIYPMDYKTTFDSEENFNHSFKQWRYDIQANLYSYILQEICKKDEYFKDFKIMPFQFIVISRTTKSPIIWKFITTNEVLVEPSYKQINNFGIEIPHWETYLHEMNYYFNIQSTRYSKDTIESNGTRMLDSLTLNRDI